MQVEQHGNFLCGTIDWDGQTGDEAERCTLGVATKRGGSPLPIRAMQEADHPEAASKDLVDSFQKKKNHNSWMRLDQRLYLRTGSGVYRGSAINGFLGLNSNSYNTRIWFVCHVYLTILIKIKIITLTRLCTALTKTVAPLFELEYCSTVELKRLFITSFV